MDDKFETEGSKKSTMQKETEDVKMSKVDGDL